MYALRLAFRNAADDRLIVHASLDAAPSVPELAAETIYEDEDSFLRRLIAADLCLETTQQLVVAVIRAIADPRLSDIWVSARLSADQNRILGLNLTPSTSNLPYRAQPFSFVNHGEQFHDFFMNSPTPFAMVSGPAHIITFVNDPYIRLIGRISAVELLGLPIRDAIPELEGQPCLSLLESAYRTGIPQRRTELKSTLHESDTGLDVDRYFDIVYQPLRDTAGNVQGIMAQATDVTERVLSREVTEHREQKLYRLWAELDTLYRALPVGLAVLDAATLHILRLNNRLAEILGSTTDALLGAPVMQSCPVFADLFLQASAGATASGMVQTNGYTTRVTLCPSRDTSGMIETITLIAEPLARTPVTAEENASDADTIFSLA